jgi:hypothetical protein
MKLITLLLKTFGKKSKLTVGDSLQEWWEIKLFKHSLGYYEVLFGKQEAIYLSMSKGYDVLWVKMFKNTFAYPTLS